MGCDSASGGERMVYAGEMTALLLILIMRMVMMISCAPAVY